MAAIMKCGAKKRLLLGYAAGVATGLLLMVMSSGEFRSFAGNQAQAAHMSLRHDLFYSIGQAVLLGLIIMASVGLCKWLVPAWTYPVFLLGMLTVHPTWTVSDYSKESGFLFAKANAASLFLPTSLIVGAIQVVHGISVRAAQGHVAAITRQTNEDSDPTMCLVCGSPIDNDSKCQHCGWSYVEN